MNQKTKCGDRYGKLVILEKDTETTPSGRPKYKCMCDCGNTVSKSGNDIRSGHTKSCGCYNSQVASGRLIKNPGESAHNVHYGRYKKQARLRKLQFSLEFDYFVSLTSSECNYCGKPPRLFNPYVNALGISTGKLIKSSITRAWIKVNGIDRIDPSKGYIEGNVNPCCSQCNYSKLDYTFDEFIQHTYDIVAYQEAKKKETA